MRCSGSCRSHLPLPTPSPPFFDDAAAEDAIAQEHVTVELPCSAFQPRPGMKADESWEHIMRGIIREELAYALNPGPDTCKNIDCTTTGIGKATGPQSLPDKLQLDKPNKSVKWSSKVRDMTSYTDTGRSSEARKSACVSSKSKTRCSETELRGPSTHLSTLNRARTAELSTVPQHSMTTQKIEQFVDASVGSGRLGRWILAFLHQSMIFLNWWAELEEPAREGRLYEIVDGTSFQIFIGVVIGLNSIFMGISADYEVQGAEASPFVQLSDYFFTSTYAVELLLKLIVHRQYFFCNENMRWNLFDTFLVGLSIYDMVMGLFVAGGAAFNAGFMRSLRILRVGKVLRIFRLVRAISQLQLILKVLVGSISALFWSLVMMAIMYYIAGLVFLQGAAGYFAREDPDPDVRESLSVYFGSVGATMCTMFMATSGGEDWNVFYTALQAAGSMYGTLFLCYIAFTVVAFLNVLTALFVEHAIDTAKPGRDDLVFFQRQARMEEAAELTKLFEKADVDGNGTISSEEFEEYMEDPRSPLRVYLEADGIDASDAALFFSLLKSCCESEAERRDVDIKAFVHGLMKIRGGATSLDVQGLVWQTQLIYKTMMKRFRTLEDVLSDQEQRMARA